MLWPHVFGAGIEIAFAHLSFKWTNNAKNNAGVTCAIIGLQQGPVAKKRLYSGGIEKAVENINAYLVNAEHVYISKRRVHISNLKPMTKGSGPTDGGNLLLSRDQKNELLENHPDCKEIVRRFVGAEDYIDGFYRYCLWIPDARASHFAKIPIIKERLEKVRKMRLDSTKAATRADAAFPHRFSEPRHEEAASIVVPRHTSERRDYVPFGYMGKDNVVSDSASAIYNAEPWLFGLISSRIHMVWVRAVAGRLEERIRYSNTICYNNFPFPEIGKEQKDRLEHCAQEVLLTRERYPEKTIAWLYDPDTMPADLLATHQTLDLAVERCYRDKPFTSDEERLEYLFALYKKMTAEEKN